MFALSLISAVLIGLLIGALLEPYVFRNSPDLFSEEWKEGDFGDKF
jgi:F0F1-type ATP synthase assembly protein I